MALRRLPACGDSRDGTVVGVSGVNDVRLELLARIRSQVEIIQDGREIASTSEQATQGEILAEICEELLDLEEQ